MTFRRPEAVLLDLDDTLIAAYRGSEAAWHAIATEFSGELGPHTPTAVGQAIADFASAQFTDHTHRQRWRLDPIPTRRATVVSGLGAADLHLPTDLAHRLADRYESYRHERMHLLPGALTLLDALKGLAIPLGLVTNGSTRVQRDKIERFDLARYFCHIQIEEEAGFGKPDPRAYTNTLSALGVDAAHSWMIGDDVDYDVRVPMGLGLNAIWVDPDARSEVDGSLPHVVQSALDALPVLLGGR